MARLQNNLKSIDEDYLGDVDLRTLLTTIVQNLHAVSHFKNETFTALQYARDFGSITKEPLKRTTKWSAKCFTHDKSLYPVPTSSMELADVEEMKRPTDSCKDRSSNWSSDEGVGGQISSCEAENSAEWNHKKTKPELSHQQCITLNLLILK